MPATIDPELRCLAGAVYFESRGESLAGQLAVARVIINRAESGRFPTSYCGVVLQRSQFSFVRGGKMPKIRESSRPWAHAVAIAQIARDGQWQTKAPDRKSVVSGRILSVRVDPGGSRIIKKNNKKK